MSQLPDREDVSVSSSEESSNDEPMTERQALIAALGEDFANYAIDANFSIYLKLVHDKQEALDDIKKDTFYPDFVHQFFVNNERIFGYKRPIIRLFYSASRLKRYVKFDFDEKINKERAGLDADDVMDCLKPVLEEIEYTQDLNSFIAELESDEEKFFKPPGDLVMEFEIDFRKPKLISRAQLETMTTLHESDGVKNSNGHPSKQNGNGSLDHGDEPQTASTSARTALVRPDFDENAPLIKKQFRFLHANHKTQGFEKFQERMQSLIMWFIESATMIDFQDQRWDFFLIFEKYNPSTSEESGATPVSIDDRYYFAGYATVYKYYVYPDRERPRVSQMVLLPPYRRNKLGTKLLQSIYNFYKKENVFDITAEDPDEDFIAMRDFLDCVNCSKLQCFQPEQLKKGWSEEIANESREKLKLCRRQSRKIYEILKLKCLDDNSMDDMRSYRLEVKNRLNIPNQRLKLDCDKVTRRGIALPEELRSQTENAKLAYLQLEENYQELMKQYQHTIDKLKQVPTL